MYSDQSFQLYGIPSVIINTVIVVSSLLAVRSDWKKCPLRILTRYFTVLSNLLCAAAALAVVLCRLSGTLPNAILILKYIGTCAVTVTLVTVIVFLGPCVTGYKVLLTGADLWLHLICPLLAIISLLLWDRPDLSFSGVFLGVIPVCLYACLYISRVILAPEDKRWVDFYGFNRKGRWPLSLGIMLAATFGISLLLWAV